MAKISIIIPCYYNEENIPVTTAKLLETEKLFPAGTTFEYVMVDDGSRDKTFLALMQFHNQNPGKVKLIKLAGNVGSYNAILAGMEHATGDCCTVISADLQDPPEMIPQMFAHWLKGIKLVMANREGREEGFFQRFFSNLYHSLVKKFALKNIPKGGFDFVLFDKLLKDQVVKINEKNTNTLYLLPWLGFESVTIPYVRKKREVGKSRWTLAKKIKLFIDSFVSFSFFPIRAISVTGLIMGFVSLVYAACILFFKMSGYIEVEGWSTVMIVLLLVSSFQMIALGIIGEYVWRALDASRNRPNYVVEQIVETKGN
jgi:polyisoprenyl-phosphate glycosyltransferase